MSSHNRKKKHPGNVDYFRERAQKHTRIELAEMYDCSTHTIVTWYKDFDVEEGVKYCKKCEQNRDKKLFSSNNSTVCMLEHPKKIRQTDFNEGEYERMKGRECQALSRYWIATEEGMPNGPLQRWAA